MSIFNSFFGRPAQQIQKEPDDNDDYFGQALSAKMLNLALNALKSSTTDSSHPIEIQHADGRTYCAWYHQPTDAVKVQTKEDWAKMNRGKTLVLERKEGFPISYNGNRINYLSSSQKNIFFNMPKDIFAQVYLTCERQKKARYLSKCVEFAKEHHVNSGAALHLSFGEKTYHIWWSQRRNELNVQESGFF